LWALQQGLLQRTSAPVAPAEMLVEITLSEPAPVTLPATPRQPEQPRTAAPAKPRMATPKLSPPPQKPEPSPVAVAAALPSPLPTPPAAPASQSTSTAPANPAATSVAVGATASSAPVPGTANPTAAAKPALQQPSSEADYLNNPKPSYPAMSRRMGEQGKVVVRTLIGTDGVAQKAEVLRSSGFERLDRAALETALKWRYVPGKRGGVAEAMWFNVPLHFVLD
jgi:protein TonB